MAEKKQDRREYEPMQKLAALWPKSAKSGLAFYEGRIAPDAVVDVMLTPDAKIVLFVNESDNPSAPKFNVFIKVPKPKKAGENNGQAADTPF